MNSRHNWDGYSHQELYDRIHGNGGFFLPDGAGLSGATNGQVGWGRLASLMANARERTEAALANAGAAWEGAAADAMRSGVTPLAQWAGDAHTASIASQSSTDAHVNAYAAAKNRMPEPVPVTSTANGDFGGIPAGFTHLFGGQTDQDKQEAAAQEAKAEAVRVMSGYEGESSAAQASVGRFVPPPSVTVDVPPPQPAGGDVIHVGVSEWPGTGRVIDDGAPAGGDSAGEHRGPGVAAPPLGGTAPSAVAPVPSATAPSGSLPVTGLGSELHRPESSPGVSVPGERGVGNAGPGFGGRFGDGGGAGRGPGSGRGPGAGSGAGAGGARGAVPGAGRGVGVGGGGPASESVAGRAAGATGARGANGAGMGPAGGRGDSDDDKEHKTAEYLRGTNDSFWDDSPPVAPSVIGDEEDD